jgi:hypothetical protein
MNKWTQITSALIAVLTGVALALITAITIVLCVFTLQVNASDEDAVLLNKDEPAPYSGVLMPVSKVQTLRKMAFDLEIANMKILSYEKSTELFKQNEGIKDESIKLLQEQNLKLGKTVAQRQGLKEFELLFAAGTGIFVTGNVPVGLGVMGAGVIVWVVKLIAGEVN